MKYKLLTLTAIVLASTTNIGLANNAPRDSAKCFNSVATMLINETAKDQELAEFIAPAEVNEVKVKSAYAP